MEDFLGPAPYFTPPPTLPICPNMMRSTVVAARRCVGGVAAARRSIWGMSAQPTGDTLALPMDIPCPAPLFSGATDTQVSLPAPGQSHVSRPRPWAQLALVYRLCSLLTASALWHGLAAGHDPGERPQGGVV